MRRERSLRLVLRIDSAEESKNPNGTRELDKVYYVYRGQRCAGTRSLSEKVLRGGHKKVFSMNIFSGQQFD